MRRLILAGSLVCAAALSACAQTSGSNPSYGDQVRTLADSCRERGGILVQRSGGQLTGNPGADHVCNISGGASRLDRN